MIAAWSPFEKEFSSCETQLRRCSGEVKEEIRLAAIKAAAEEAKAQAGERALTARQRTLMHHHMSETRKRDKRLERYGTSKPRVQTVAAPELTISSPSKTDAS